MALRIASRLNLLLLKEGPAGVLAPAASAANLQLVRHRRTKHWNPKWKLLRRLKVIKVELPKFNENLEDMSEEEVRSHLKKIGVMPARPWMEKPIFISSTGAVFEPYVPPEGDGKVSPITAQGAKQNLEFLSKKSKTMMAIRKIRAFDENFDTAEFCKEAHKVYVKAHECMMAKDEEEMIRYVTERAFPEMMHNVKNKTIRWRYIKDVEVPRVVHARCTNVVTKENIFAQITVRFHTQQSLAVYDRFGRLIHGSEILAKDVLEYVVFEKHVANEYGSWRVHDKIIPDWMPPREPFKQTFRIEPETEAAAAAIEAGKEKKEAPALAPGEEKVTPVLTA